MMKKIGKAWSAVKGAVFGTGLGRSGADVCLFHYGRFPAGKRCRVCGLAGGYTDVKRMVAVLDNTRELGKWKLVDVQPGRGGPVGVFECDGDPEAWEEDGVLRVDWLGYRKPFAFDGVEIMRAEDAQVEEFVQQARFQSEESVRLRLRGMDCLVASSAVLTDNTLRVLGTTFGRVDRVDGLKTPEKLPGGQRRLPWVLGSMVWIEPGRFLMGSPPGEEDRRDNERPQTEVTLTNGFWLGRTPVTQREWEAVMGNNPSYFKGTDRPVEMVSWIEAMEYCRRLTERERQAGRLPHGLDYTLPTEAQWEYACRAGTRTRWSFGDDENQLCQYAWFGGNSTQPVGQKEPNGWGLYDMHGNVWEWTRSWYGVYPGGSVTDYEGPASGTSRVLRGGSWYRPAAFTRSAYRFRYTPGLRYSPLGFRPALSSVP